jgi:cysteinyl-tRNA synthetase
LKAEAGATPALTKLIARAQSGFEEALDDDLNTAEALAALHDFVRETNGALARSEVKAHDQQMLLELVERFDTVFNIFGEAKQEWLDSQIQALIDERQAARQAKNFARSDQIRDLLAAQGIILEDTKDGMRWRRK